MATYTDSLKLVKPAAGDGTGTWGTTINASLTDLLEQAIAGRSVINTWSSNLATLTASNGAVGDGRAAILQLDTGTGGSALTGAGTLNVPDKSKVFVVFNNSNQIVTVKVGGLTGVAIPAGKTSILHSNGTDIIDGVNNITGNATMGGTLGVTGNATVGGTLGVTGNVSVNTNKFTVAGSDGDTAIAGTLAVTGVTTATGGLTGSPTVSVPASGNKDAAAMTLLVGQRIISIATAATAYTLPDTATAAIPVGSTWVIVNADPNNGADITIQAANDNVIALCSGAAYTAGSANGTRTIVQGGVAEIVCVADNLYVIFGGGVS